MSVPDQQAIQEQAVALRGTPLSRPERTAAIFDIAAKGFLPQADASRLQIMEQLAFHKSDHWLEGDTLVVPLEDAYMAAGPSLVRAVMQFPFLKPHIAFYDKGVTRPYDDVVWDLADRGLSLARAVFRRQAKGRSSFNHIVITPPVMGRDSKETGLHRCDDIAARDKHGENIRLVTRIAAGAHSHFNNDRKIIQTSDITLGVDDLNGDDKKFKKNHLLILTVTAGAASIRTWHQPAVPKPQEEFRGLFF